MQNFNLPEYCYAKTEVTTVGSLPPSVDIKASDIPSKTESKPVSPAAETQEEASTEPDIITEQEDISGPGSIDTVEELVLTLDMLPELEAVKTIQNIKIPVPSDYRRKVFKNRIVEEYKTTFKDVITTQDDILRAIEELLRTCHG